jgi:hypothetical protein
MNWNKNQMFLKLLEEKLRALSNIETPPMLEAKLVAQIPGGQLNVQRHLNYRWFEFWNWGLSTAFAATLVLGVVLFYHSTLSTSNGFVADPVEMPFSCLMVKQNTMSYGMFILGSEPNFKLGKEPNCGIEKGL